MGKMKNNKYIKSKSKKCYNLLLSHLDRDLDMNHIHLDYISKTGLLDLFVKYDKNKKTCYYYDNPSLNNKPVKENIDLKTFVSRELSRLKDLQNPEYSYFYSDVKIREYTTKKSELFIA